MLSGEEGFRSPVSWMKKAVEEVEGRRVCDFTIGLRAIIAVLLCRIERTLVLVICEGMGVIVRVSVEALRKDILESCMRYLDQL